MMTPEQIAAMRADADAGTPADKAASRLKAYLARRAKDRHTDHEEIHSYDITPEGGIALFASDIATIIAQAAEIARLTGMLAVQWEGIPWRDGPPPAEWRDGRQVLVWEIFTGNPIVFSWDAKSDSWTNGSESSDESCITHHAAITAPVNTSGKQPV